MARILIIEDDDSIRELYTEALAIAGHDVDAEMSLDGALRVLHTVPYDAVITDGGFLDGPCMREDAGLTVCAWCVARGVPVLLVTGRETVRDAAAVQGYEARMKPCSPADLVAWVAGVEVAA